MRRLLVYWVFSTRIAYAHEVTTEVKTDTAIAVEANGDTLGDVRGHRMKIRSDPHEDRTKFSATQHEVAELKGLIESKEKTGDGTEEEINSLKSRVSELETSVSMEAMQEAQEGKRELGGAWKEAQAKTSEDLVNSAQTAATAGDGVTKLRDPLVKKGELLQQLQMTKQEHSQTMLNARKHFRAYNNVMRNLGNLMSMGSLKEARELLGYGTMIAEQLHSLSNRGPALYETIQHLRKEVIEEDKLIAEALEERSNEVIDTDLAVNKAAEKVDHLRYMHDADTEQAWESSFSKI